MSDFSQDGARRSFLTSLKAGGAVLAAAAATGLAKAENSPAWKPARHDKDDWFDQNSAKHRVVFDTTTPQGLSESLFFADNYLGINNSDYGVPNSEIAVVVIMRYQSVAFGYNDAMWSKYGEPIAARTRFKDPKTSSPAKLNIYNSRDYAGSAVMNPTIDSLTAKGVQLAVCNLATRNMSIAIASATGGTADAIYKELAANLVRGARLVPAGIVAVNRAQERGYTLMSV